MLMGVKFSDDPISSLDFSVIGGLLEISINNYTGLYIPAMKAHIKCAIIVIKQKYLSFSDEDSFKISQ